MPAPGITGTTNRDITGIRTIVDTTADAAIGAAAIAIGTAGATGAMAIVEGTAATLATDITAVFTAIGKLFTEGAGTTGLERLLQPLSFVVCILAAL